MVTVACVSDTHLAHRSQKIEIPDADILVHAGDCTKMGRTEEVAEFSHWFASHPHKHKVMIAGNHDFLFQRDPGLAKQMLDPSIIYLQDSEAEVMGLKFYGSPWQPWFCGWAFNLRNPSELRERWDLIPEDTDVLITHGPPLGILDFTVGGEFAGCEELRQVVKAVKPFAHVFGHIHEGHGTLIEAETEYVNASVLDERYIVRHSVITISIEKGSP